MTTILLFILLIGQGKDTIPVIKKQISNSLFIDCHPYKEGLAALAQGGKIYQINLTSFSSAILSPFSFSTIATDRNGMLWAADSNSSYYSLRDTGWKWEGMVNAHRIWGFAFDKNNNLFLITSLGIFDQKTEMFYGENKYRKFYSHGFARSAYNVNCYYMDYKDRLWMGSNSRSMKEIHVFSTRENKFITSRLKGFSWFRSIQGIFGHGKHILFIDSDWMFGMSSIKSYKKDTMIRIHHPEYDTMTLGPLKEAEEYIGAAFINNNNELYYYSNQGLLKAKYNSKKNKLEVAQLIMASQLAWTGYEFEARDFVVRLKKMFSYQSSIVYLHTEEGIFVYDGRSLLNLK